MSIRASDPTFRVGRANRDAGSVSPWLIWRATPASLVGERIPAPNGIARCSICTFCWTREFFAVAPGCSARRWCFTFCACSLARVAGRAFRERRGQLRITQLSGRHPAFRADRLARAPRADGGAIFTASGAVYAKRNPQPLLEDRAIWWSQQTIVAVYFVAGITKLFVTKGLWVLQARWIGVSVAKSAYQSFYDTFDQADLQQQLRVAEFAAAHGWIVALIAAGGLFLELGSPLMLWNRASAAIFGALLIAFPSQPRLLDAAQLHLQPMAAVHLHDQPAVLDHAGRPENLAYAGKSHPHDLVAAVDVNHLPGDRRRAVAREKQPVWPISAGSQLRPAAPFPGNVSASTKTR